MLGVMDGEVLGHSELRVRYLAPSPGGASWSHHLAPQAPGAPARTELELGVYDRSITSNRSAVAGGVSSGWRRR